MCAGTHQSGKVTELQKPWGDGRVLKRPFPILPLGFGALWGKNSFFSPPGYALKWNIQFLPGMIRANICLVNEKAIWGGKVKSVLEKPQKVHREVITALISAPPTLDRTARVASTLHR